MGRMGRPRHPDILTPREWEVLALLRERLTNEDIASRLGITLDGAKYHVSQILPKLGVSTREEAAAWRPPEKQPWWMAWPVWARIIGAATIAAAVAGLAVLALGVLRTRGDEEVSSLRDNALYGRIVYLAPADHSQWIAPPEQLAEAGIVTTATPDQFRQAVTSDTAAIIIDRGWALQLDRGWVRSQYEQGVVIVGIGINMSEMPSVLGLSPVGISGDFGSYPESRRFYSLISKQPCGGGASQDYLDLHPQSQFNLLIHRMANDATLPNRGGEMLKAESQC